MSGSSRCGPVPTVTGLARRFASLRRCVADNKDSLGRATKSSFQLQRRFVSESAGTLPGSNGAGRRRPAPVTWLTPRPAEVDAADIVSSLHILPRTADLYNHVPVFLLTPAFAHWVGSSGSFLHQSMQRVFQNRNDDLMGNKDIYSIVCVVDKLPSPYITGNGLSQDREYAAQISKQDGYEGVSVMFADMDELTGKTIEVSRPRDVSTSEVEPTLAYSFHSPPGGNREFQATEIGIRVANTLFQNGKPRTLFASCWKVNPANNALVLENQYDLANCRIKSTAAFRVEPPCVPLHPVTQPRQIMASMGNIVSKISKGDGSGTAAPASAELEKALPAYLKEHGTENQRLAVWACIKPVVSTGSVSEKGDHFGALKGGARIHRVVSGGGGWGKKQGLLSLDPEYSYEADNAAKDFLSLPGIFEGNGNGVAVEEELNIQSLFDDFPNITHGEDGGLVTPLSEIAKPGDSIQFFVAPLDAPHAGLVELAYSQHNAANSSITYVFGVTPSLEANSTNVSVEKTAGDATDAGDKIITVPYHFGALTEKGLTYRPTEEVGSDAGEEKRIDVKETKIDVPGSRIMIELV